MSTNSRHLGRGESGCPVPCGAEPDTTFKDQLLLRTYPGTERSSLPTAGVHDLGPGLSDQSPKALIIRPGIIRICFLFTMSWNPQERACRLLAGITHSSETCFGRKQPHRRSTATPWWSQTGSNRRPHACKARALPTELRPHSPQASVKGREARSWKPEAAGFGLGRPAAAHF